MRPATSGIAPRTRCSCSPASTYRRPDVRCVAVLGDSITEGVGTPDNANLRWPDQYAARFRRRPAVANLGISGNRVLLDDARFGPGGQSRFDRDVLGLPNLATLVMFLGINDIQQPPSQTDPTRILTPTSSWYAARTTTISR